MPIEEINKNAVDIRSVIHCFKYLDGFFYCNLLGFL